MLLEMRFERADGDFAFLPPPFILFEGRQRIPSVIGLD